MSGDLDWDAQNLHAPGGWWNLVIVGT